jgi:hypothetical protein
MTTPTRGDFSFLKNEQRRAMFEDAFQAIEIIPRAWEYLSQATVPDPTTGFMFSSDPFLTFIGKHIDKDGKIGHSGSSYAATMRVMEFIAKQGWEAFVERELSYETSNS